MSCKSLSPSLCGIYASQIIFQMKSYQLVEMRNHPGTIGVNMTDSVLTPIDLIVHDQTMVVAVVHMVILVNMDMVTVVTGIITMVATQEVWTFFACIPLGRSAGCVAIAWPSRYGVTTWLNLQMCVTLYFENWITICPRNVKIVPLSNDLMESWHSHLWSKRCSFEWRIFV